MYWVIEKGPGLGDLARPGHRRWSATTDRARTDSKTSQELIQGNAVFFRLWVVVFAAWDYDELLPSLGRGKEIPGLVNRYQLVSVTMRLQERTFIVSDLR